MWIFFCFLASVGGVVTMSWYNPTQRREARNIRNKKEPEQEKVRHLKKKKNNGWRKERTPCAHKSQSQPPKKMLKRSQNNPFSDFYPHPRPPCSTFLERDFFCSNKKGTRYQNENEKKRENMNDDLVTVARETDNSKRVRRSSAVSTAAERFADEALQSSYETFLSKAQTCFLQRRFSMAAALAARAARICPTPQIFALLAAIQEGTGHFDRASDFRLLQAFLAKDVTLWEELLGEFLQQKKFFKATVCLQRLSAIEQSNAARFRSLQIQLADLLVGLGEVKRASVILINLWQSSRYRDFEIFASLSSMFFQLGRWSALNQLIKESMEYGFKKRNTATSAAESTTDHHQSSTKSSRRHSKRVAFFDEILDDQTTTTEAKSGGVPTTMEGSRAQAEGDKSRLADKIGGHQPPAVSAGSAQLAEPSFVDDFSFDHDGGPSGSPDHGPASNNSSRALAGVVEDNLDLTTPAAQKNFLTLINVHAELLNEQGKFERSVTLIEQCAAQLRVPLLDLPPDLLLRYGVALTFIGGGAATKSACFEVFNSLLLSCPFDVYGDALYDAAVSLESTGCHEQALHMFESLRRYQKLVAASEGLDASDSEEEEGEAAALRDSTPLGDEAVMETLKARADRQLLKLERREARGTVKTSEAALTFHIGKCMIGLGRESDAFNELRRVLQLDPGHADSRVELSRLYVSLGDLEAAAAAVQPRDADDAYQATVLSAQLLPVLRAKGQLLEAIGVGVALFQLFLADHDDTGDRMSTVSGASSRRRGRGSGASSLYSMPSLTRASSSLVPASALSDALGQTSSMHTGGTKSMASMASSRTFGLVSSREAIATSFRSTASPMSVVTLSKRGSMTSTYAGTTAATTIAGGGGGEQLRGDDGALGIQNKDSSQLFAFNRRRKTPLSTGHAASTEHPPLNVHRVLTEKQRIRQDRELLSAKRMEEYAQMYLKGNGGSSDNDDFDGGGSVGNLSELEEMERLLGEEGAEAPPSPKRRRTEGVDESGVTDGAAPMDLEKVAELNFPDPQMAALFVECTGRSTTGAAGAAAGEGPTDSAVPPPPPPPPDAHAILRLLGRTEVVSLAVHVMECYYALERFVEAKEFGSIILVRWGRLHKRGWRSGHHAIAHKLRLALLRCSLASGSTEDAVSTALQLLNDCADNTGTDWARACWAVLATISNVDGGTHSIMPLLVRLLTTRCAAKPAAASGCTPSLSQATSLGSSEIPLEVLFEHRHLAVPGLCILANNALSSGMNTRSALNTYLLALSMRPRCPFLNFMVGICYCLVASQRVAGYTNDLVSSGLHYLQEYRRFSLDDHDEETSAYGEVDGGTSPLEDEWLDAFRASTAGCCSEGATCTVVSDDGRGVGASFAVNFIGASTRHLPPRSYQQRGDRAPGNEQHERESKRLEVDYNTARVLHFLGLHYLCAPLYESVVVRGKAALQRRREAHHGGGDACWSSTEDAVVCEELEALIRCASLNLYLLYSNVSENRSLGVSWLPEWVPSAPQARP